MMIAFMAATKDNPGHRTAISSPLCMFARAPNLVAVGRLLEFNEQELNLIRSAPGIDLELLRKLSHEDKRWLILKGWFVVTIHPFCPLSLCRLLPSTLDMMKHDTHISVLKRFGWCQHCQQIQIAGRFDGRGGCRSEVPGVYPANMM